MSDYEATAYLSLEKLKEKHMLEFQQFQERIRKELSARMKFSRDLLELRDKEGKLVKVKRYEEAEKIKMKADLLEEFERNKLEAEVSYNFPNWFRCKPCCRRKKPSYATTSNWPWPPCLKESSVTEMSS